MRRLALLAATALALCACTPAEQQESARDVRDAAHDVGAKTREVADSPAVQRAGAEVKEAAGDVGQVLRETAKGAAAGAREGIAKAKADNTETDAK